MPRNLTSVERTVRLITGLTLIGVALVLFPVHWWIGPVALIPLGTAILGYCPLYQVIGYDPCRQASQ